MLMLMGMLVGYSKSKTAYSRYKGCTYRESGAAPARGAGINEAPLYTVAPFSRKLNADEFFIKYFFCSSSGG